MDLAAYVSKVSFGHTEDWFLTVWTLKKVMSEFVDDDFS